MKVITVTSAAALALATMLAPAAAGPKEEIEEACEAFQAEYGGEADCTCLGEAAAADTELYEMLLEITSPEDIESAPQKVLDAIDACS
ncbi:MAG: hypothetical protein AAFV51_12780 [Pseudomonadota bacterium]